MTNTRLVPYFRLGKPQCAVQGIHRAVGLAAKSLWFCPLRLRDTFQREMRVGYALARFDAEAIVPMNQLPDLYHLYKGPFNLRSFTT